MISFVYFDLGGVVIRDFSGTDKWEVMKKYLKIPKDTETEFDDLFDKYEHEELCINREVDTLIPIFKERLGINFPEGFSFLDYMVSHFEKNPSILPVISETKRNGKIGLLTNMYPKMFGEIKKRGLLPKINWDVIIDSSIERIQKPENEIYDLAEKRAGVNAEKILFVDNSRRNLVNPGKKGWHTFIYDSSDPEGSSVSLDNFYKKLENRGNSFET